MRTRSQNVSPGGFVSLETPRRKKRTTTTSSGSPTSQVKKPAAQPAKRGRKATKKKTPAENESSQSETLESGAECENQIQSEMDHTLPQEDEEATQGELPPNDSHTSKVPKESQEMQRQEPSTPSKHAGGSMDTTPRRPIKMPKSILKKTPSQPSSSTDQGHFYTTPANSTAAASTPASVHNAGSNLYAAAVEAMQPSPAPVTRPVDDREYILRRAMDILTQEANHIPEGDFASLPENERFGQRIMCPCCQDLLPVTCKNGHNPNQWAPISYRREIQQALIYASYQGLREVLQKQQDDAIAALHARQAARLEELREQQRKKRSHAEMNEDDDSNHEGSDDENVNTPSQKRRMTASAGHTPIRNLGYGYTASPHERPFAAIRERRAAEREGRMTTTLFRLPLLLEQQEAAREAREQAEQVAADEAAEAASRAAISRYTVDPSDLHKYEDSYVVPPRYDGEIVNPLPPTQDNPFATPPQRSENTQTPPTSGSAWGLRGLLDTVSHSVNRYLPFGRVSTPETPNLAGADSTHSPTGPSGADSVEAGVESQQAPSPSPAPTRDLTYSLFPRPYDKSKFFRKEDIEKQESAAGKPASESTEKDAQTPQAEEPAAGKKRKRDIPSPDVIPNPPGVSYGMDPQFFELSDESDSSPAAEPLPAPRTPARPKKRVRFDTSPVDTPSKLRERGEIHYEQRRPRRSTKRTPRPRAAATDAYEGGAFVGLDNPFSPAAARVGRPEEGTSSPPKNAAAPAPEALAKVRSLAEKHKPKTPSGLRAARRYSSSPLVPESPVLLSSEPTEEELLALFGDDGAGRAALALFQRCPSGDLRRMEFPASEPLAERAVAERIDKMMSEADIEFGYSAFCEALAQFEEEL